MAQVPYTPVPNVRSDLPATPQIHVDMLPAAFGANIADAVKGLGATSDQVGNELFSRAMAMQDLHNQSMADQAQTGFQQELAQVHSKFMNQYGENAGPAALDQYSKDVTALRSKYAEDLDNPMAQKYYNQETRNVQNRINYQAADHSAQQLNATAVAHLKTVSESATDLAMVNPSSPASINAALAVKEQEARENGARLGQSPEDIEANVAIGKSNVYSRQIQALVNRGDVQTATKLLDQYKSTGAMRGEDLALSQERVDKGLYTVGPKQITNGIQTGTSLQLGAGVVPMERAKDAIANGIESGGDYQAQGKVLASGDQALGKYQIMKSNLSDWLQKSGQDSSMTPEQFLKNPAAQDKVFETIFGGYMQKYGSFNDAAAKWFTGKSISEGGGTVGPDALGTTPARYLAATNSQLAKTASLGDKVTAARAQAARIAPDKPLLQDAAESHMITAEHTNDAIAKEDFQTTQNTINDSIIKSQQAGTPISTIDDLKKDPTTAQAIEKLNPTQYLELQKKIQVLSKQDDTPSSERTQNYQRINGWSFTNQSKFLDLDPNSENLTTEQRSSIITRQKQLLSDKSIDDPHLKAALGNPNISSALKNAGITEAADPDDYNRYVGALADQIKLAQGSGKPLSYQDTEDLAKRLLQDHVTPGRWWGTNTNKLGLEQPGTDSAVTTKVTEGFRSRYNRDPSPEELQTLYTRQLFKDSLKQDKAQ